MTADALAAIAVARELEIPDDAVQKALRDFEGIGRRFDILGEVRTAGGTVDGRSGDHVMLGGVRIPHDRGLAAHSDGDVALHADDGAGRSAAARAVVVIDAVPSWRTNDHTRGAHRDDGTKAFPRIRIRRT